MNWSLVHLVFACGVLEGVANLAGVAASALGWASYYPAGERDWRFYAFWALNQLFNGALILVAVLDWNAFGVGPAVLVVGAVAVLVGLAGAVVTGLDLGTEETMGMAGELRTGGWYRYSRNPQYVCYLLATAGFVLLAASPLATVLCLIYVAWWLVLPFAEEPWLRAQYGSAYDRYAREVPRFLGVASLRPRADGDSSPEQ